MKRTREDPTVAVDADAHKRARPSSDEEEELPYGLGSIVTIRRIERTYGGCAMDEAKSAVQKYSRRDEFDKALKFAIEMDLFSLHPDGRHIQTNLWNRFKIIALEDVSLANVNALIRIDARLRCLEEGRKRRRDANGGREPAGLASPTEQQALVDIVWALCTSKHCRLPSHYNAAFCKPEVLPALAAEAPEIHRQLEVARGAVECPPPRRTFPFSALGEARHRVGGHRQPPGLLPRAAVGRRVRATPRAHGTQDRPHQAPEEHQHRLLGSGRL